MIRAVVLLGLAASCSAFVATPVLPSRTQVARAAPLAAQMVVEPASVDAATQLMALQIPVPALTPAKVGRQPSELHPSLLPPETFVR